MIYEKLLISLGIAAIVLSLAWILNRLTSKEWNYNWSKIISRTISRGIVYASIIVSAYLIVRIWDLPEKQLILANNFLFVLTVIFCTLIFISLARGIIEIYKEGGGPGLAAATLTQNMANAFILALGVLVVLNHFGIAITPMLTAMGIGGIAIALGLQDTLSNVFAGIYIIWAGRMQIGDYIKLSSNEEGYVHDIAWRETRIRTRSDNIITIPNSLIAKVSIINFSRPSEDVDLSFMLGVAYDSDLAQVETVSLEVAREVLRSVPGGLLNFEPYIRFKRFADSSIELTINLRVRDFGAQSLITHELLKKLHVRYAQEKISIPYPTQLILTKPVEGT